MKSPYLVLPAQGHEIRKINPEKYDVFPAAEAPINLQGIFERHLMDGVKIRDLALAVRIPKKIREIRKAEIQKGFDILGLK